MVLAGALLSSCGALHPGAAAVVGDKTIPMSKVDQVAGDYCHAITKQLQGDAQVVPLSFVRRGVAGQGDRPQAPGHLDRLRLPRLRRLRPRLPP
jgi:hypothetical protein